MSPQKLSQAEKTALWFVNRRAFYDTLQQRQSKFAAALQQQLLSSRAHYFLNMGTRLQVRSFPLGCQISIDGKLTPYLTPHTFFDLSEGKHLVELHYHDPETNTLRKLHREVILKPGKRIVCKLYFKKPVTLAPVTQPAAPMGGSEEKK